VGESLQI